MPVFRSIIHKNSLSLNTCFENTKQRIVAVSDTKLSLLVLLVFAAALCPTFPPLTRSSGRFSMPSTTASSSSSTLPEGGGKDDFHLKDQDSASFKMPSDEEKASREASISSQERRLAPTEGESRQQRQSIDLHRKSTHNSIIRAKSRTEDPEKEAADPDDPNVVSWDGPDDPQNPMNFSSKSKLLNIGVISGICFVTPLASSMFAPGVPYLMSEFKSHSSELASFVVSVYVLGFAIGPLAFAPLSEVYGRLPVYHVCNVLYLVFTIACALATNLNMLIGFRFLAGMCGSAPITNGGGSIADIIEQAKRGKAMSGFALGPIIGPIVGPVAGGYLTEALGWRWVFWLLAIISGFFTLISFVFMRETYAPVLLQKKTNLLRKETGNLNLRSNLDSGLSNKDHFLRSIIRPARMLVLSPIVLSTSLYVGVVYGYLYLLFTTFGLVFQGTYGFSTGTVGLTYIGLGVGSMIGVLVFGLTSDRTMNAAIAKAEQDPSFVPGSKAAVQPEFRLPMMIYTAPCIPVGLLIYAWTTDYAVHWIVPIMATGIVGIGNMMAFMCILTYLVDAFSIYAASALAANTVLRSIMGAVLPLCGQKMYESLGLGWGSTTLSLIAFAFLPVPIVIYRYGEQLRKRFEIKNL